MTGNNTGVLDKTETIPKGEWGAQLREQATLLKSQNDYFFNQLKLKKPKPGTSKNAPEQFEVWQTNNALLEEDDKSKKKQHEKELKIAEWKPRYEDRLKHFEETVTELREYLPATEKVLLDYDEIRIDARRLVLADPPGYEAAYNRLPSRKDMAKATEEGEAAHGKAVENARQTVPDAMNLYDGLVKSLETADIGPEAKETLDEKLQDAIFLLLAQGTDVKTFERSAIEKLNRVKQDLENALEVARQEKNAYDTLLIEAQEADKLLRAELGLSDQITESAVAELRRLKQNAASAYALKEYGLAKDGLQAMLTKYGKLPDIGTSLQAAEDKWKKSVTQAGKILEDLDKVVKSLNAAPKPGESPGKEVLENRMKLANIGTLMRSKIDFFAKLGNTATIAEKLEAPGKVQALQDEFDRWKKRVSDFDPGKFDKKGICETVDKILEGVKKDLDLLPEIMTKGGVTSASLRDGVLDPLKETFASIQSSWEIGKNVGFDPVSLGASDIKKRLKFLKVRIAEAGELKKLLTLANDNEISRARDAMRQVIAQADEVALLVISWSPEQGLKLREQIDTAEELVAGTDAKAIDKLCSTLLESVNSYSLKVLHAKNEVEKLRQSIDTALTGVPEKLAQIRKVLDEAKDASPAAKKPHIAMLATLEQDLGAVQLLRGSEQIMVLQEAVSDANALREEVDNELPAAQDAVSGVLSRSKAKKGAPTLEKGRERLVKLAKKMTGAKDAELYLSNTHAELDIRIKDHLSNLGSISANKLAKEIDQLWLDYEDMKKKAEGAKKKYEAEDGITSIGKEVEKLFKNDVFDWAPDYLKQAQGELKTILQNGKTEGYLEQALEDARKFKSEMERALGSVKNDLGVPVLIIDRQQKAKGAKDQKELDKVKWESELHIIEKDLKEAKKLDEKEIKGLIDQLSECKDKIKNSENYASGRSELEDIRTRLALIENNPKGLKITARNKLKPVNHKFQESLHKFGAALKSFKDIIEKNTELDQQVKVAVGKELTDLRLLFNPSAFVDTVEIMTDVDGNTEKERSAAREKGLREARRMAAYLKQDPRLLQLANNPFLTTLGAIQSEVSLALLDLENNMLVSL